jgi:CheY-like chemotaxis protein
MKRLLVVDDNNTYADNLIKHYKNLGYDCTRAYTANDGWEKYLTSKSETGKSYFDIIITDITMETQTSGLWFIRRVHRDGFSGQKIIATTGFDVRGVMAISRFILPWFAGISYMIPKVPLKKGIVELIPIE